LEYKGLTYKEGFFLTLRKDEQNLNLHKLKHILITINKEIFVLSERYKLLEFNEPII